MPADPKGFTAGQIVMADWRGDARPKEANKRRPAVVVEDSELFAPFYPNVILVPLSDDPSRIIPDLATHIDPSDENGCTKPCAAMSHLVTATSKHRVTATRSRITPAQLTAIRAQIAECIGVTPRRP